MPSKFLDHIYVNKFYKINAFDFINFAVILSFITGLAMPSTKRINCKNKKEKISRKLSLMNLDSFLRPRSQGLLMSRGLLGRSRDRVNKEDPGVVAEEPGMLRCRGARGCE